MQRVSIGVNLEFWTSAHTEKLKGLLTEFELKNFVMVRATIIFYSHNGFATVADLFRDGFDGSDFRWMNVSQE